MKQSGPMKKKHPMHKNRRKEQEAKFDCNDSSPGEIICVPTQEHSDASDGVLQFLALLAYPHTSEKTKRDLFATALHSMNYKARTWNQRSNKHDSAIVRVLVPREYRLRTRKIEGTVHNGFKRLMHRLKAGNVATRFFFGGFKIPSAFGKIGLEIVAPQSVRGALIDLVRGNVEHGYHRAEDDATENERKLMWLPSMPVLHLCLVFFGIVVNFRRVCDDQVFFDNEMYFHLVRHPEWLRDALLRAEGVRGHLHNSVPEFDPNKAVRLLPSEMLPQETS